MIVIIIVVVVIVILIVVVAIIVATPPQYPFVLGVLHVQEQPATATCIADWMQQHAPHIPLHMVALHNTLDTHPAPSGNHPAPSHGTAEALAALLDAVQDDTAREDLARNLRMHLLHRTAAEHGYSKLVLGETSTTAAVQVIAAACKGQGSVLPALVSPYDARCGPCSCTACLFASFWLPFLRLQ